MAAPAAVAKSKFEKFEEVCGILQRYGHNPSKLIPILQAVQEVCRYLPEDVLTYVATSLNLPVAQVYGVATFYAHFTLKAKGKYVIRLCNGTACNVRASIPVLEAIQARLGLSEKKPTSDDQVFTIELVSCLGACGLAPVVMVNDEVHGQMKIGRAHV